ncbi:hypothetical protein PV326_010022, partial [Microctonus aethiopoides]
YIIMCNVASTGITLCRFLENRASNILPYKIYLPYNYTKPFLYRFTVLLQSSTLFIAGNVAAGFDTLFFGVMLQIISKINILKHRFQVTVMTLVEIHDKKSCYIKDYNKIEDTFLTIWIKSHKAIISLYAHIEFAFSKVIFAQYSFSALSLCITVYLISQMEIFTTEFMGNFAYLIAATCEIFVFCIAANQVTFEFSDLNLAIYNTKWFALSMSAKKNIILIMVRTLRPINFSTGFLVTLSLESFKSVIKVAYSMYSVLKS